MSIAGIELALLTLPGEFRMLETTDQILTTKKGGGMKKVLCSIAVLAVALIGTTAFAFGIPGAPGAVREATEAAKEVGFEQAVTDIANKYQCQFVSDTATTQTKCKNGKTFEQMVDELRGVVSSGRFAGKRVYLKADVEGNNDTRYPRERYVRSQLERVQRWYRISVYDHLGSSNFIRVTSEAY